ncbi:hypothetical protein WOLCODRAFT_120108 [Wolfiporia cocos MD-104 SS10]|uniref:Uncharacterized protein n=1 Tax=Wolfiporia cocos (strain MD-104) TaxID=742152 RepID=A0A2H3JKY8_WOLCO|nr:hypothetical protein WOLCODRAFT_120108 [Wolfiporia cocos MD-104 SS10]
MLALLPIVGTFLWAMPALAGPSLHLDHQMPLYAPPKDGVSFYDPRLGEGSMLDDAGGGVGEPLNVIISGLSSPAVLNEPGIVKYAQAIGFSTECFGIHMGPPMPANLGDGNGWVEQTIELRHHYDVGSSCMETIVGGNHFRVYIQNGTQANSGALFLAVSKEEPLLDHHTIVPNGYNLGRDRLVRAAAGVREHRGVSYNTIAETVTGLLPEGKEGINHGIAIDGNVTLLTVTIL